MKAKKLSHRPTLTRRQAPAPTALERARDQLQRVRLYDPGELSGNEQTILALGDEMERLERILRRAHVRIDAAAAQPYPPDACPTGVRDD